MTPRALGRVCAAVLISSLSLSMPLGAADKPDQAAPAALPPGPDVGKAGPLGEKPTDVKLEPFFNGKDLTGWSTKVPELWKVEGDVLVGQSNEKKTGDIIKAEKTYDAFVFETEVRYPDNVDTGVMWGKPEVQVQLGVSRSLKTDMSCSLYYGGKYPEPARAKGIAKVLKLGEWNTLRIESKGQNVKVWLNGQHVLNWTGPVDIKPAPIGLQIHAGVEMKVEFRNMKIAELK